MDIESVRIAWCTEKGDAGELARFFARNVSPDYVSHSELQGPRALGPGRWRPDLDDVVRVEMVERIGRERGHVGADQTSYPVLAARDVDRLVGLALVTFCPSAPTPYAIVEDLVVEQSLRGAGIGKFILHWIAREADKINCERIFLESGRGNDRAHHFFEQNGFEICSIVMMKALKPSA